MLAAIRDRTTWSLVEGGKQASWTPGHVRVPKNGDSRSKRFLEPRLLPHQYWGLEFRTSLTGAGDCAKCGAKVANTLCVIYIEVTGECSEPIDLTPYRTFSHCWE